MKRTLYFFFVAGLFLLTPFQTGAQTTTELPGPPKILLIVREEIKTGKMTVHSGEANNVVQIWAKANSPHHRLAMVPVAGNENEVLYFWPFENFAALEKSSKDLDNIATVTHKADFDRIQNRDEDYHSSQRDAIAVLREDLSYNPAADIAKMRFMRVQSIRVKPGHIREFEEGRKIVKAAHEKAKIDENMAVYQFVGGAQNGTYLVLIPWKSLDGLATIPHGKSYFDAMGEDNRKKLDDIADDSILLDDVAIYAFNPLLSYVSARFIAADPGFWTFRPLTLAGTPAPKKGTVVATKKR